MFLFPFSKANHISYRLAQHDSKLYENQPINSTDHLRTLNVPFCLNFMAGGKYGLGNVSSFTSLSGNKPFLIERKDYCETESNQQELDNTIPNWGIGMHQHDYFEFMFVLEGMVEHRIEDGCYLFEVGEACLLNRNIKHYEVFGTHYLIAYLCFSKSYIKKILNAEGMNAIGNIYRFFAENSDEQARYTRNYLSFSPFGEKSSEDVSLIINKIASELKLQDTGYHNIILGLLERLFGILQNTKKYETSKITFDSSAESALFLKITEIMESQLGKVSRTDLSKELNYSGDYLNRVVKKHTGMNLSEYRQKLCLSKASELIRSSDYSISSIIHDIGFENRTYFYKLFESRYGMSPTDFRKMYRQ